jgi:hypothetical protein
MRSTPRFRPQAIKRALRRVAGKLSAILEAVNVHSLASEYLCFDVMQARNGLIAVRREIFR